MTGDDVQDYVHRFTFGDNHHTETWCGLWSAQYTTRSDDFNDADINCPHCIEKFNKAKYDHS